LPRRLRRQLGEHKRWMVQVQEDTVRKLEVYRKSITCRIPPTLQSRYSDPVEDDL
jgi:hypothetical protein